MAHTTLPPDLPIPTDDGAAAHLPGTPLPALALPSTLTPSQPLDLSAQPGTTVLFIYPRSAAPTETVPPDWDVIPGARGCTPQARSFRAAHADLHAAGAARVVGVSSQSGAWQAELAAREGLPYALLSDEGRAFARALRLPTFEWRGEVLLKRMAAVVRDGVFVRVFYPVFPPDQSAEQVLAWMQSDEGKAALREERGD